MSGAPEGPPRSIALGWAVLRAEGLRAVLDRARDRREEARRSGSFLPVDRPPEGFRAAVLNVAAGPPAPRLGGVQAQLLWRLAAEAVLRPVALLYPLPAERSRAGGSAAAVRRYQLELSLAGEGGGRWAMEWPPAAPAAPAPAHWTAAGAPSGTGLVDPDFEAAVEWAMRQTGASALHVEGLAGMPLASLRGMAGRGMRLVLALHDLAAFCPRPHLWEEPPPPAHPGFCRFSRNAARCARCLATTWPALPPGYQEVRREEAQKLLAAASALVHPSAYLARVHRELFPGADPCPEPRIIPPAPPPLPPATGPASPARTIRRPPVHIAWVGAVHAHKGALVFAAAVNRLRSLGRRPRLSAYGGGDRGLLRRWRRLPGLKVHGYYRAGTLADRLRTDRVDLALVLSIVPESYGLTLDECAAAQVPAVVFDLGAQGERLPPDSGFRLPAAASDSVAAGAEALSDLLRDLLDGTRPLPSPPPPPHRTAAATAAAWRDLYRQLGLAP